MKLTAFFLLAVCLQAGASGYAQKITLAQTNVSLKKIFKEIERQSEYHFFYKDKLLKQAGSVSVNVRNATVEEVLDQCFKEQPLTYAILDKTIVVKAKKLSTITAPASGELTNAPPHIINGSVKDAEGNPLAGVSVIVRGTNRGTSTTTNGSFSIEANEDDILEFTIVGYQKKSVNIGTRVEVSVVLELDVAGLSDVVIVGYGTQKKSDLTGAIDVVDMDAFKKMPSPAFVDNLQGQASGVNIIPSGRPGANPVVRIRGINTFGDNEPLYIIDGAQTRDISTLNPNDVESVQILKDAASASIYGARAANGVIIISTKKGRKGEKMSVEYTGNVGVDVPIGGNVYHILSPMEMAQLSWLTKKNSGISPTPDIQYGNGPEPVLPDFILPEGKMEGEVDFDNYYVNPDYTDPGEVNNFTQIIRANKKGTDWFHEIYKPALNTEHNLNLKGSSQDAVYFFGLRYLDQKGTLRETYSKQFSIRFNSTYWINKHIRIGENINYTLTSNPDLNNFGSDPVSFESVYRMQPIVPVYDVMGNFAGGRGEGTGSGNAKNVVGDTYRRRNNKGLGDRLMGNVFAEIDFLKDFTLRTNLSGSMNSITRHAFAYPTYENVENIKTNRYSVSQLRAYEWTWSNTIGYKKRFQFNEFDVLAGVESNRDNVRSFSASRDDYFSFDPDFVNLDNGSSNQANSGNVFESSLFSYFGKLNYGFQGKYLASATIRRDASSRFLNHQAGWFPAFSLGWRISQEDFMNSQYWINDLKVRGGYGIMGNQINVPTNNSFTLYAGLPGSSFYPITGSNTVLAPGLQGTIIGNPDARWEKDANLNIGFDGLFFQNRLDVSFDYYVKDIKDLLYNPALLATQGNAQAPFANVARMRNSGVDIKMDLRGGNKLKYDIGVNFTSYKNRIERVSGNSDNFAPNATHLEMIRNQVGHPISGFFGYNIVGFWNSEEEIQDANSKVPGGGIFQDGAGVGRFRYEDVNGDNRINSEDRMFLGDPNPDFTYGVNFGLSYKSFDLSLFFFGSQGNDLWNNVKQWTDFSSENGAKSKTALYNSWTPDNHNAKVAIQETVNTFSSGSVPNSYFVEDASFLKLKSVQIGYNFPQSILGRIKLTNLRVFLSGSDIFTLTKYSGVTPEVGGQAIVFGVDKGLYPIPKRFRFGISLNY